MTPKEQYEARKAARLAAREAPKYGIDAYAALDDDPGLEIMDLLDRTATALERIADAMEGRNA